MSSLAAIAKRKPFDVAQAGSIEVVSIEDLHSDPLYQRDLIAQVVENIANDYDIVTAGTIVVSQRPNGDMFIVDGQHRVAGAKLAGETHVLAQVIENMTPEDEAKRRIQGNYKKTDKVYEIFRARVFAGDPVARGITALLAEFDTQINYVPDYDRGINAVSAVEGIYKMDDGVRLRRILQTLTAAFGDVQGAHANGNLLKSVGWFIDRHGEEADIERLISRMTTEGVGSLTRKAVNMKAVMGGTQWINMYRALVEVYNERLADSNKLEWRTLRSSSWKNKGGYQAGHDG